MKEIKVPESRVSMLPDGGTLKGDSVSEPAAEAHGLPHTDLEKLLGSENFKRNGGSDDAR